MPERFIRKWGPLDECGARNLVDAKATLRGLAAVKHGKVLSLGLEIRGGTRGPAAPNRAPVQHFMVRDGGDYASGMEERHGFGFADDTILLPTHGTTHIDALCHVWQKGKMYNNFDAAEVKSRGANRCGIEKLEPIVTRAIFVDLGGRTYRKNDQAIHCAELSDAVARTGVKPEPGDALLIRTGWLQAWRNGMAEPLVSAGLHKDCADWIIDQGFAVVAADNPAVEVLPSQDPDSAVPLHIRLLRDSGIYLAELLDLEELAACDCASFMLTIAPLRIKGGSGSPITPVAVL
jgi:kynurenine formamidase